VSQFDLVMSLTYCQTQTRLEKESVRRDLTMPVNHSHAVIPRVEVDAMKRGQVAKCKITHFLSSKDGSEVSEKGIQAPFT